LHCVCELVGVQVSSVCAQAWEIGFPRLTPQVAFPAGDNRHLGYPGHLLRQHCPKHPRDEGKPLRFVNVGRTTDTLIIDFPLCIHFV
jgi:hypothetical protein